MKRINAVPHMNTVFRDVLKLVPWAGVWSGSVDAYGTDALARRLTTKRQLIALLYGQMSDASSLREIEASMASHQARLYHAGGAAPARSTFADANRQRDLRVFSGLFEHMLAQANRGLRRKMGEAVRLIDSTGLRLAGVGAEWGAVFRRGLRRQGARGLRSRPRPSPLSHGHRGPDQRHRRRQGDADGSTMIDPMFRFRGLGQTWVVIISSCSARKVSQLATFPRFSRPSMNQRVRLCKESRA